MKEKVFNLLVYTVLVVVGILNCIVGAINGSELTQIVGLLMLILAEITCKDSSLKH